MHKTPQIRLYEVLDEIQEESIRAWTRAMLDIAPGAFWERPSSSTGKYHKPDENAPGGQVLHTLRVVTIAEHLAHMDNLSQIDKDCLLSGAILHDICKYGLDGSLDHTCQEHPQLVEELRAANGEWLPPCDWDKDITAIIGQHMGRWTKDLTWTLGYRGRLLHVADYIASRHNVEVL